MPSNVKGINNMNMIMTTKKIMDEAVTGRDLFRPLSNIYDGDIFYRVLNALLIRITPTMDYTDAALHRFSWEKVF